MEDQFCRKFERSGDGTIRIDYDGFSSVVIPSKKGRYTLCVSTQVGCSMQCKFCRAGEFVRNLCSDEIIGQFSDAVSLMGEFPYSVVFMGSGEPLMNSKSVFDSIGVFNGKYGISHRHITVSTSGINFNLLFGVKCMAALSVHSLDATIRTQMMPHSPYIADLLKLVDEYCLTTKKELLLEFALIDGLNDRDSDIELILNHRWPSNVNFNLIEFNDHNGFVRSNKLVIFKEAIRARGHKCFIRESRGNDIKASCGMLSN